MKEADRDQPYTRSVARALTILQLFTVGEAEVSLSEISQRVALHQSTVFRMLATLGAAGFTEQNPLTGRYRLGPAALSLGQAFLRHSDLRQLAEAPLAKLRDHSSETVHLATLHGTEVFYLEKLPGLHPIGLMSSRVGDRAPAHCTGLGKALLAHLPESAVRETFAAGLLSYTPHTITRLNALLENLAEARRKGFAIDDEEHEVGVVCIAAAVLDSSRAVAAISASGPAERIHQGMRNRDLTQAVLAAAAEISAKLGGIGVLTPPRPQAAPAVTRRRAAARTRK